LLRHKAQKREAALRAASLFWALTKKGALGDFSKRISPCSASVPLALW